MIYSVLDNVKISAIAASVPEDIIEIENLIKRGEDEKYIKSFIKNTGIKRIHKASAKQTSSDFAYTAAKQIEGSGRYIPDEIGVLIYITQTPDYRTPSTAYALQKRLGLNKSCITFDVNLGCSGFVYGVSLASSLLCTSNASKALVLIGDTLARKRNPKVVKGKRKSNTSLLFGDGSAAILIEKKKGFSISTGLMSDGTGHKALSNPYNAWKHHDGPEAVPGDDIAVFNFTINEVPDLIKKFMEREKRNIDDYDAFVLHQANKMIIKQIARKVGMPIENVPISLDKFGNTSGASIPLTIVDKYGIINNCSDIKVLSSGYGVGLSWGVVSITINTNDVLPLSYGCDYYDDGYPDEFI